MIRIAICDDEEIFLKKEESAICGFFSVTSQSFRVDSYLSGNELLTSGDCDKYDLIFLDVNMNELDGIETAKRIRKFSVDAELIFVTAFVRYSLDAYQVNAARFILKDDFLEQSMVECLYSLIPRIRLRRERVNFPFREETKAIKYSDILYVERFFRLTFFYLNEKKRCRYTLVGRFDQLEEWLGASDFVQIQNSCFVNFHFVTALGRFYLVMSNGERLNISRNRFSKVCQEFISFKGGF